MAEEAPSHAIDDPTYPDLTWAQISHHATSIRRAHFSPAALQHQLHQASEASNILLSLPIVELEDLPENSQDCHICKEPYQDPTGKEKAERAKKLPCNHILGADCLAKWFESSNTCPLCRAVIVSRHYSTEDPPGLLWRDEFSATFFPFEVQLVLLENELGWVTTESATNSARLAQLLTAPETVESRAEVARVVSSMERIDLNLQEVEERIRELGNRHRGGG